MKNLIILCFLLSSSLAFACGDLSKKPSYLRAKKVECTALFGKITEPTMTINGKTYPFAMTSGDMDGGCPADQPSCYPPYLNIVRRGNAICRAYGFKGYGRSNDFGIWRDLPDQMAALKRSRSGTWTPVVVNINHDRNEYIYTKTIFCYPNYRKR